MMKLDKLKAILEKYDVSCCIILNRSNVTYFTDFNAGLALSVCKDEIALYVPRLEYDRALEELKGDIDVIAYAKCETPRKRNYEKLIIHESLVKYLIDKFRNMNVDKVCIDSALNINTKDIQLININRDILEVRAVKDWNEIERIMKAIKISEKAFNELLSCNLENLSERRIAAIVYKLILDYGGDDVAFKPIIASGPNTYKPHHEFSDRVVKKGDVLIVDFGAKYRNYCSDLTRTLCLGYVDSRMKDMYYAVLEAQKEAIKNVKHGIEASKIDEIARQVLKEYGFYDHFIHGLGHGVGIDIHEKPSINPCSGDVLQEGNIITIEPGIYIKDNLGIRVEDMILVEKNLGKVLTSLSRDIFLL